MALRFLAVGIVTPCSMAFRALEDEGALAAGDVAAETLHADTAGGLAVRIDFGGSGAFYDSTREGGGLAIERKTLPIER
jgi:hypothetical protein